MEQTATKAPKCANGCNWRAWNGGELCLNCAATAGDPAARAVMAARSAKGREARSARIRAARVPLSTYAEIRGYVERLAGIVSNSKGDALQRVNAGVRVAAQAIELLKLDLEKQAKELHELLERHPALARRLASVPSDAAPMTDD